MIGRVLRAVFYTGRHHIHRQDAVLVAEVAARIRRESIRDALRPPELFGLPAEFVYACFGTTPEQMGAMSV